MDEKTTAGHLHLFTALWAASWPWSSAQFLKFGETFCLSVHAVSSLYNNHTPNITGKLHLFFNLHILFGCLSMTVRCKILFIPTETKVEKWASVLPTNNSSQTLPHALGYLTALALHPTVTFDLLSSPFLSLKHFRQLSMPLFRGWQ